MTANRFAAARAYAATRPMQGADSANAQLQLGQLFEIVNFDGDAARLLKTEIAHLRLFARSYHKIQGVAYTVADLNAEATISWTIITEALA